MTTAQGMTETERRIVAVWAADCAERVLPLFDAEAPDDDRARDAIARARAFARGELTAAGEIRRRFVAGRLTPPEGPDARAAEVRWQLAALSPEVASALRRLPPLGTDTAGPLGPGLLTSGTLGEVIREIQAAVGA